MRRIAYCSPVNPVASGISDYSEELLPFLGQYADLTLFVEPGLAPSHAQLRHHLAVHRLDELLDRHRREPFDAVVYHMGNSPAHGAIYELAQRLPGVVVLHEWVLHHFKLWHAAERRKNIGAYLDEMRARYGGDGERVARKMSRGQLQDAAFDFPLAEDVVEQARGVIAHSRFVAERSRVVRPDLPVAVVPMGVPLPPLRDRDAARDALGIPRAAPLWASFGHINPYKRMESALRAFRRLLAEAPDARYVLVGSVSPSYDLQALIQRMELGAAVTVTGYVPREDFERYVAASDLCINLRAPTAGETSASLLRLLGGGRPTLVSNIGAFAELPDDVCAKVDLDWSEAELIAAYDRLFRRFPQVAAQLGQNARGFVAREHSLDGAARGYMRCLADVYGWNEPLEPRRPVLWTEAPVSDAPAAGAFEAQPRSDALPSAVRATLADLGTALAELGIGERDRPTRDAATTLADLFEPEPSS